MRKQRVILKHIADAAAAGRYADLGRAVIKHALAQADVPGIRAGKPDQALQGQAFARARRAEQNHMLLAVADLVGHIQAEGRVRIPERFAQMQRDHRDRLFHFSFSNSSAAISRLTQTAEVMITNQTAWTSLPA